MNDADWIRLLGEQSPRELTDDEIAALRERIQHSPAVRQAARDSVQLEQTLSAGLGAINLSAEDILQRILEKQRRPKAVSRPTWWKWIGLTATVLLLTVFSVNWLRPVARPVPDDEHAQADSSKDAVARTDAPSKSSSPAQFDIAADNADAVSALTPINRVGDAKLAAMPWTEWLAEDATPLPVDSPRLVGDLRAIGHDELSLAEFRRWWDDVPNQRAGLNQDLIGQRRTVHLQGWARLKAPWLADTQIRLTPFDVRELALFFWTGDTGVALRLYRNRDPHLWTAYEIHRKPGETTPDRWGLLTTDSGAVFHSGAATFEVTTEAGHLVLSTGQTPVLSVPMPQLPTEVLLSAESRFRGFSWLRTAPRESVEIAETPSVFGDDPPAAWSWRTDQAAEAMLQREPDGGVTLTGTSRKDIARVYVPLDRPGLFETVLQLAAADPGTGVYLGDANGQPLGQLGFFKDRRTSQTTFGFLRPNERRFDADVDLHSQPAPYFVPLSRQRIVAGLGIWNTWCSGDGGHWGHVIENPVRDVTGAVRSIGLYCLPGETPRTIRLQHCAVRPLAAVDALVAQNWQEAAGRVMETPPRTFEDWLQRAWDAKPLNAPTTEWCDTCAVAALHAGPPRDLANSLLDRLLTSAVERGLSPLEQRRLFDEALRLTDQWGDQDAIRWARRYARLGQDAGNDPNGVEAWTAMLQAPRWTHRSERTPFQQRITGDLIRAVYRDDWITVRATSRRATFDTSPAHPDHQPRDAGEALDRLARWSRGAMADARAVPDDNQDDAWPVSWRHPAAWAVNKDAYNISAELHAALSAKEYRDAGRVVTSLTGGDSLGLLPDRQDPALLISLPVALAAAQRDVPEFAAALRTEFGELGDLRVTQAIDDADAAALEAATLQFLGTPAAARAEQWLGDQQLAIGEFLAADLHYRRALQAGTSEQAAELRGRHELASLLTGPLPGESVIPSQTTAELHGIPVTSLAAARRVITPAATHPGPLQPTTLPMQRYKLEHRGRFDGQTGQNAGRGEYRDSDPFGRQFGVAVDDRRIYLSNRFQVTAYDRNSVDRLWATAVGGDQGEAHAHRFTAMTPLVVGDRLYVRRMTKAAVELAAMDAATGNVLWTHQPGATAAVLSDPVWIAGRLFAIVGGELEQDLWDLRWTEFDPATGQPWPGVSVVRMRNAWDKEIPCQLALHGPQVVMAVGGVTASFDLLGNVLWMRRELWLPPRIDPLQFNHFVLPPAIVGNVVVAAQPNVRVVEGLDRETGRRLWRRPLPELMGLVAVRDSIAFAGEPERVTALDVATGGVLWQTALLGWLGPMAIDDDRVTVLRQETRKDRRGWLTLSWLDRQTGRVIADSPVEADEKDDWQAGPWFVANGRVWTLTEAGFKSAHRDLSVLTPLAGTEGQVGSFHDGGLGPWTATVSAEDRHATQVVLPGWQPLLSNRETLEFVAGEVRGERAVLRTKVSKGRALSFGRTVSLRDDAMPVLQLRVGRDGDTPWTLIVRVDDQIAHEQVIDTQTAPSGWCDVHLPLGAFNGQTFLLQVQQHPAGDKAAVGLWKAADLVEE